MGISWEKYIAVTRQRPARKPLVDALQYVDKKEHALNIGAGAHMDSRYLLESGFDKVTSIDPDPASQLCAEEIHDPRFEFYLTKAEDYNFKPNTYDLISAQMVFPYIERSSFPRVLCEIKASLTERGILTVWIFGDRNGKMLAKTKNDVLYFSREETEALFSGMEVLDFIEEEKDQSSPVHGKMTHYHEFFVIARKK